MRLQSVQRPRKRVLAICGGGNAGHALAIVTSRNFDGDVVWLAGSHEKAEVLRRGVFSADGLRSTGVITGSADRIRRISADAADVIPNADIVMIAVPAYAHADILRQIAPHLKDNALIGSLPTRSGFEFEATHFIRGIEPGGRRRIFGLQTLPWSTRVQEPGKVVNFGSIKAEVLMAALPSRFADELSAELSQILGTQMIPTQNFLNMTLGNPGQVIHPGLMYGLFATWAGQTYSQDNIPLFYAHASDRTGDFVAQLSNEICTVAKEIETRSTGELDLSGVSSIHDWLRASYPTQTKDTSTVATCFRTGPLQARKAPMQEVSAGVFSPNFQYRYLSEDVPFGLSVAKALAQMAEVRTPAIDAVISWAQIKLGKQYLLDGKLDGPDAKRLPIPQNYRINTLADLINWYAHDRSPITLGRVSA